MRLKGFGIALVVIAAVCSIVASSAMAKAVESNGFWYIESAQIEPGTEPPVVCDLPAPLPEPGPIVLTTIEGKAVKLTATGFSCPKSVIFNQSSKAKGKGFVQLSGVTVAEPSGCKVEGGTIESAELAFQVWMEGSKALVRFAPAAEGGTFAKIGISGTGCPVAGSYAVKGTLFGEMVNATKVSETSQRMRFSGAINSAAGGALTLAGKPVTVTMEEFTSKVEGGLHPFSVNET